MSSLLFCPLRRTSRNKDGSVLDHPSRAEQERVTSLLHQYARRIKHVYFEHKCRARADQSEAAAVRHGSVVVTASPNIPHISGVVATQTIPKNTYIASYDGYLFTLQQFKDVPFPCPTAVHLPDVNSDVKNDGLNYVVVGLPTTVGANVNCMRNVAGVKRPNCCLRFRGHVVAPVVENEHVMQRGYIRSDTMGVYTTTSVSAGTELLADYGDGFWQLDDIFCQVCLQYSSVGDNKLLLCDDPTERCHGAIHRRCLPSLAERQLPNRRIRWKCARCVASVADSTRTVHVRGTHGGVQLVGVENPCPMAYNVHRAKTPTPWPVQPAAAAAGYHPGRLSSVTLSF
jgi:hypothetical protein